MVKIMLTSCFVYVNLTDAQQQDAKPVLDRLVLLVRFPVDEVFLTEYCLEVVMVTKVRHLSPKILPI